ncbi:intracellular septation protein A [Hamadaea flava]|uniref:VC0807 family protein n=1 Tax=Hamadaea flava TaxID=1742688 RepID=A0ABV8LGN7_9ACTN|nr:VC0807 family protein [Hamadaea flava]MCP2324362.1 intracellular septation protein A [Hamadaea flava]
MSRPTANGPAAILLSLVWDVGLSLGAYFVAKWLGADDYVALLAGSVVALLRVIWVALRSRKFDVFATVMVGVFGIGLLLSVLTGDAKFMLAKESLVTGAAGLAFVISCFVGKPLIYHAALRMREGKPEEIAEFEQKWADLPGFRRNFRIMSAVWGAGLLADAVGRIPVIYSLSTDAAVTASSAMLIAVMVLLSVWNGWFVKRIQARTA